MSQTLSLPPDVFLTQAGVHRLRGRIAEARAAYLAVCADNEAASQAGDSSVWHDNFAYEENQRQMHRLARRVRDLEEMLGRAKVVPACSKAPSRVQLGAQVRLRYLDEERETTLYIAGYDDGDPQAGRISYTAPLALRVVGAEPGEVRTLREGGRSRQLEIVELLAAPGEEQP
jgi:transcription elongation factor GreA